MTANYLVTGGAGFIGSHIVDRLVKEGHRVRVLDNLSTGKKENLEQVKDKIELVVGDIRDFSLLKDAVAGIDYILHQAAVPSTVRSFENPVESLSVNAGGTLQLLIAAEQSNVKCFVYASSSSVYGNENNFMPESPYGTGKLLGEQYCMLYNRLYGLNTVCLRYFNIFGPRQNPNSQYAAVIPRFICALRNAKKPVIFGDGEQSRDFTFVENVVYANLTIRNPGIYDIGCGTSTSVNRLYNIIKDILDVDIPAEYATPRQGDIKYSCAKIDPKIYNPKINLLEGLKITIHAK